MTTRVSYSGPAAGSAVTQFSSSALIVTVDIAIAARSAAGRLAVTNFEAPMGGISVARKGGSIIVTGSGRIGFAIMPARLR